MYFLDYFNGIQVRWVFFVCKTHLQIAHAKVGWFLYVISFVCTTCSYFLFIRTSTAFQTLTFGNDSIIQNIFQTCKQCCHFCILFRNNNVLFLYLKNWIWGFAITIYNTWVMGVRLRTRSSEYGNKNDTRMTRCFILFQGPWDCLDFYFLLMNF